MPMSRNRHAAASSDSCQKQNTVGPGTRWPLGVPGARASRTCQVDPSTLITAAAIGGTTASNSLCPGLKCPDPKADALRSRRLKGTPGASATPTAGKVPTGFA